MNKTVRMKKSHPSTDIPHLEGGEESGKRGEREERENRKREKRSRHWI